MLSLYSLSVYALLTRVFLPLINGAGCRTRPQRPARKRGKHRQQSATSGVGRLHLFSSVGGLYVGIRNMRHAHRRKGNVLEYVTGCSQAAWHNAISSAHCSCWRKCTSTFRQHCANHVLTRSCPPGGGLPSSPTLAAGIADEGQAGDGSSYPFPSYYPVPNLVVGSHTFTQVSTGARHVCGVSSD